MPSKKPLPDILTKHGGYGLRTLFLIEALGGNVDAADKQARLDAEAKQLEERLLAVYAHFDIDPATADAQFRLIVALCKVKFPRAFSFDSEEERKRGRKVKWSLSDQLHLVLAVKIFERYGGMKQRKQVYSLLKLGMKADTVKTRHSEALRNVRRHYDDADLDRLADELWNGIRKGTETE